MMTEQTTERASRRALAAVIGEAWAITEPALEQIIAIAAREHEVTPEALQAYRANLVPQSERLGVRGPVAVLDVRGPLFRYANIFTAISGATSYDVLRRDLQVALDDPDIRAIVLNIDSPGGSVSGVDELAQAIFDARGKKPVTAYVGGTGASAAYWLASQASEVVVSDAAIVGSIGVRAVLTDTTEADKKAGRVEFISSQSPGKRADLATDEGRARVQRMVDSLADVFVSQVARGRGVSAKEVLARFGAGDVMIGAAAVRAGMADRLGNFEAIIAELAAGKMPTPSTRRPGMHTSDDARAERARIKAILTDPAAKGREPTAMHLAFESDMDAGAVVALLATLPQAQAAADPLAAFGPRAKDAPGGLVTVDPTEVMPRSPHAETKEVWAKTVARLNGGAA